MKSYQAGLKYDDKFQSMVENQTLEVLILPPIMFMSPPHVILQELRVSKTDSEEFTLVREALAAAIRNYGTRPHQGRGRRRMSETEAPYTLHTYRSRLAND